MRNNSELGAALVAVAAIASAAGASTIIEFKTGPQQWQFVSSHLSGVGVTIPIVNAQPGYYRARTDVPTSEDIGHIVLFPSNPDNDITFLVTASNHIEDEFVALSPGAVNWAGFETTGDRVRLQASIFGDLTN